MPCRSVDGRRPPRTRAPRTFQLLPGKLSDPFRSGVRLPQTLTPRCLLTANCGLDLDFVIPRNRNSHTRSSPHPTPARGPSLAAGQEWDTAAGQVAAAGASSMVSAMHALAPILELVTPSPSDSTRRRGHGHCKAALQRWPAKACNATLRTQWTNSSRSMSRAMACLHHMVSDRANTDACTTLFRLAKPTTGPGAPRWQNLMSHVQVQCVGTFIVRSGARAL